MSSHSEKSAVRVMVRVRPFNKKELGEVPDDYPLSIVNMRGKSVDVMDEKGELQDTYDYHNTFWSIPVSQRQFCQQPFADQEAVFQEIGVGAVTNALKGYHTCIFAYGQTGSGKTHTMLGSMDDPGLAPRLVRHLYERMEEVRRKDKLWEHDIKVSFMEIYNEKVKDLIPQDYAGAGGGATCSGGGFGAKRTRLGSRKQSSTLANFQAFGDGESAGESGSESPGSADPEKLGMKRVHSVHAKEPSRRGSTIRSRAAGGGNSPARRVSLADTGGRRQSLADTGNRRQSLAERRQSMANDDSDDEYAALRVRNSPEVGIYVEGLKRVGKEDGVVGAEDVISVMRLGMEHRTTAATAMNATSSRSHAVFQLCVTAKNPGSGVTRYAHINIVDLAGSERIKMSKVQGQNLKEATRINLSLSTLRRVIDILIENSQSKKKQVPPYRESMLTWILSESLGGNSKTQMIATVSPAESNREDTINTLRYALKAKAIVNTARVNEKKGKGTLSGMQRELQVLRDQLENSEEFRTAAETEAMRQREIELVEECEAQKLEIEEEEKRIETLNKDIEEQEAAAEKQERALEFLRAENVEQKREEESRRLKELAEQHRRELEALRAAEQERVEKQRAVEQAEAEKAAVEAKHQAQAVETADIEMDKKSRKNVMFREAFKKAFILRASEARREELRRNIKGTYAAKNFGDIEGEEINIQMKDTKFLNMQLQSALERVNGELASKGARQVREEMSRMSDVLDLECTIEAIEDEIEHNKRKLDAVKHAICRVESGSMSPSRGPSYEATLKSRIEAAKAKARDSTAEARVSRDNAKLLAQLHAEITNENEAIVDEMDMRKEKVARLKQENSALCDENRILHTELVNVREKIQDYKGDIASFKGRSEMLSDKAETLGKAHAALKDYANGRFFPTQRQRQVVKPDWIDEDLLYLEGDAHREWVNRGMRYKRQTSPGRSRSLSRQTSLQSAVSQTPSSATGKGLRTTSPTRSERSSRSGISGLFGAPPPPPPPVSAKRRLKNVQAPSRVAA